MTKAKRKARTWWVVVNSVGGFEYNTKSKRDAEDFADADFCSAYAVAIIKVREILPRRKKQ